MKILTLNPWAHALKPQTPLFRMKTKLILPILTLLIALMGASAGYSATFTATATGNWDSGATWGHSGNNTEGSGYPGPNDTATINSGVVVTLFTVATYPSSGSLASLNVSGTLFMDRNNSNTGRPLNVAGDVTVNSGGTIAVQSTTTGTAFTSTLSVGGNFSNSGTLTVSSGTADFLDVTLNGTAVQSIGGTTATVFNNLTIANTSADVSAANNFSIRTGATMTVNASATFNAGTFIVSGAGTFTLASGAALGIGDPSGITAAVGTATGNIRTTTARNFVAGADYIYNGTTAQTTGTGLPATINSLTDNNTGGTLTMTRAATTAVTTRVTLATGANISLAAGFTDTAATFTVGGVTQASGTWGSTSSTAANKNNTFFAATTGILNVAGGATKLVYTTVPGTGTAGTPFSVTVQSQDANGNPANLASATTITLSKATGTGALSGTLTGSIGVGANSVTISTPVYSKSDTMTLTATASGGVTLTAVTSGNIVFSAGAATKLAFTTQPGNGTGGSALSTQPMVTVQDANGNTVTTDTSSVTLAIGTNPGGGTLSGTKTVAAVAGVATFSGLSIDKIGTGYSLGATDGALTSATSSAFNITLGAAVKLAFTTQPGGGTGGTAWTTQPVVTVQDAGGNTVTTDTSTVTLAIANNAGPGGGLSGTVTKPPLRVWRTSAPTR